ncbi:MAG: hypothetical protein SGI74_08020 [Oligoflexia bacterium]|nr:hypothetical protein [Oligoflexia bacterium]
MSKKYFFLAFAFAAGIYLTVPGCGNKSSNNNPASNVGIIPIGGICQPGQPNCVPGGVAPAGGIPLLNGPAVTSLDSNGSIMVLSFGAPNITPGQAYAGPVSVSGTVTFGPGGCISLPPGQQIPIQGQGFWTSGFAGSIAGVQANLQLANNSSLAMNVTIQYGVDTHLPGSPTGFYMQGQVSIPGCSPITYTAL